MAMILSSLGGILINDYMIKDENEKTHQIDHILVNRRGVFVIETKNYGGKIYGSEKRQEWVQSYRYGKVKNKFYSPVKQNLTHVYHVAKALPKETPIYSLVVFLRADIKDVKATGVVNIDNLEKTIERQPEIMDDEAIRKIESLLSGRWETSTTTKAHVSSIKKTLREIEDGVCPRCGGKLVIRNGKNGKFYGCEHYPKCKFMKKA